VRNKYKFYIAIVAASVLVITTGTFMLLRTPAPKPAPLPIEMGPQSIPGVPQFNTAKYSHEPEVVVWRADQGIRERMFLEKYLEGVVAKEMQPTWPLEALRAQAIASRTLTLSAIDAGTIQKLYGADVSTAKEELQAYAPEKVNDSVREAIRSTRGEVLLYAGSLVNAIYSASNGQISATKEESFPLEISYQTPYFQPVVDDSFRYTPAEIQSWTVKISAAEVADAIGYSGNPGDITILEKGPSGRILYIGAGGKKVYGSDFRKRIGFDRLKSTLVTEMTYDGKYFIFKGLGWGNGVGLCQWGAYAYSQDGLKAEDILKHYYIGANIVKLWD